MTKKKKNKSIKFRKWLNKPGHHSTGLAFIEGEDLTQDYPYLHLTIGDCSRLVTLDFNPDYHSLKKLESSIANSRHKLSVLREALDKIEEGLDFIEVHGVKVIKDREKKRKEAKKKAKAKAE